jgi:hypothetical protein
MDAQGFEVQILSSSQNEKQQEDIDEARRRLEANRDNFTQDQITRWEERIRDLESKVTGGIYGNDGRDSVPNLNAGWNSVHVVLDESEGGNGWEFTISINGQQVNQFAPKGDDRSLGGIGFQAHDGVAETVFKNVRWRELSD